MKLISTIALAVVAFAAMILLHAGIQSGGAASGGGGLPIIVDGTPLGTATSLELDHGTNVTLSSSITGGAAVITINATGGGGATVTAAPPYIEIGSTFYASWNMYAVTKPTAPTYLNSVTCSSATTGTNGDLILTNTAAVQCFGGYTATSSVEGDFQTLNSGNTSNSSGIWLWDSTNNTIYSWNTYIVGSGSAPLLALFSWNYNGTGNPAISTVIFDCTGPTLVHLKLSVSAGTLTASASANGGANFVAYTTAGSIGTISKGGFLQYNAGTMDLYSLVVN